MPAVRLVKEPCSIFSESVMRQGAAMANNLESAWVAADACVRSKHEQVAQASRDAYEQAVDTVDRRMASERPLLKNKAQLSLVGVESKIGNVRFKSAPANPCPFVALPRTL